MMDKKIFTTADFPAMPCLKCKEPFWPRASFVWGLKNPRKTPTTFYFCDKCIACESLEDKSMDDIDIILQS